MGQRAERRERTRRALLSAARGLFADRGIAATRTADVARAAGVSHGTVFVHFPTRDDLVAEVIAAFVAPVARRIGERAAARGGVREVLAAHLEGLRADEAFHARLAAEGPFLPPPARSALAGLQTAISRPLRRALEREIEAGTVRPVSFPLTFNTWLGLVRHYLANRELFAPGRSVIERYGEELVDHLVGLLAV